MAGKSIYFTEKELEMLNTHFDFGNLGFEGHENEEELWEIAYSIRKKVKQMKNWFYQD